MLMGFYKPGATNTPPAPLADKLLPNSKQAQKRSLLKSVAKKAFRTDVAKTKLDYHLINQTLQTY